MHYLTHFTPGNTGTSPVYLIPASGMPMVQQPFVIINPTTDLSSLQQLQQANILAGANPSISGTNIVANPSGGYLLVSPGHGAAANFSMPLVNIASTTTVNSSQPAVPSKFQRISVCLQFPSLTLSLLSFSQSPLLYSLIWYCIMLLGDIG